MIKEGWKSSKQWHEGHGNLWQVIWGIVKDYLGVSLQVKVLGVINDENKFEVKEYMNEHQEDFIITNV